MTRTEALEEVAEAARGVLALVMFTTDPDERSEVYTARLALRRALRALDASDREGGTACAECGCARGCHGSGGCTGEDGMGCDCPAYAAPRPSSPAAPRCIGGDMPGCSQPPVPGTSLCWGHGGDLVAHPACPDGTAYLVGTVKDEDGEKRIEVAQLTGLAPPASPECRHERVTRDGDSIWHCVACGAIWRDDGCGWRLAAQEE